MALDNPAFPSSYGLHQTPQNLVTTFVQTVLNELQGAHITGQK